MTANPEGITRSDRGSRLGLVVALSAAAIGVIYGYDTGVIAGVLLFVPKQFHLSTSQTSSIATAVALGMIVGALLASKVANVLGRRVTMIGIAGGYVVFAALSAVAQNIVWLDGARFLLGITIGLSTVVAPIFIAESSPAKIRGSLLVSYQLATVAGIMIAYFVAYALAPHAAWRWMLGISAVPALAVGVLLLRLPNEYRGPQIRGANHLFDLAAMLGPQRLFDQGELLVHLIGGLDLPQGPLRLVVATFHDVPAGRVSGAGVPGADHRHQRDRLLHASDLHPAGPYR